MFFAKLKSANCWTKLQLTIGLISTPFMISFTSFCCFLLRKSLSVFVDMHMHQMENILSSDTPVMYNAQLDLSGLFFVCDTTTSNNAVRLVMLLVITARFYATRTILWIVCVSHAILSGSPDKLKNSQMGPLQKRLRTTAITQFVKVFQFWENSVQAHNIKI